MLVFIQRSRPVQYFRPTGSAEFRDALRLHEGQHFEKLVQRAEAAGHEDEAEAVFDEADFA